MFPLNSPKDHVSKYQAFYIYALKHNFSVNIGSAIMIHIKHMLKSRFKNLLYDNMVFRILESK